MLLCTAIKFFTSRTQWGNGCYWLLWCHVVRATSRTVQWCSTAKLSTTLTTSCEQQSSRTATQRRFDMTSTGIWYVARHLMCRKAFDVSLGIWYVARHLMCRKAFDMSQGIWYVARHLICRKAFDMSQGIWYVARHLMCRKAFDVSQGIWYVARHLICR